MKPNSPTPFGSRRGPARPAVQVSRIDGIAAHRRNGHQQICSVNTARHRMRIFNNTYGSWEAQRRFWDQAWILQPHFRPMARGVKQLQVPADETNRVAIWENAFPHHRHIFMTRCNKGGWPSRGGRLSKPGMAPASCEKQRLSIDRHLLVRAIQTPIHRSVYARQE